MMTASLEPRRGGRSTDTSSGGERWMRSRLVLLTDRRQAEEAGHDLLGVIAVAVEAGVALVLLREKDLPASQRLALGHELQELLAPVAGRLIVASDATVAAGIGAGVHLAATDPWPARAASWRGPSTTDQRPAVPRVRGEPVDRKATRGHPMPERMQGVGPPIVGRSCHSVDELRAARREGASYATLSPVFASASKPGYGPALGVERLAAACAAVPDLPVLALGGIGPGRAADCLAAGAHGVAVMGEVMRATDPAAVTRRLIAELTAAGRALNRRGNPPTDSVQRTGQSQVAGTPSTGPGRARGAPGR